MLVRHASDAPQPSLSCKELRDWDMLSVSVHKNDLDQIADIVISLHATLMQHCIRDSLNTSLMS